MKIYRTKTRDNFRLQAFLAGCAVWFLAVGLLPLSPAYSQDKIVAVVNNEVITQKDLNDFLNFMRLELKAQYGEKDVESKIGSMKSDLLNKLIEDRLILQEAKKGKTQVDEGRVKAKISEIRQRYASDAEFQATLMQQGLVQADIESRIREQLLMLKMIDIKVRKGLTVKPSEVTDFYEKNSAEFNSPEQRELQAVNTADLAAAQDVYSQLKAGGDFAAAAKSHSLEVNRLSAYQGEELRAEIEDAVFKLNSGEFTEPLKIDDVYYIFKCDLILTPRQQSLSEVQEKIYSFLMDRKIQEAMAKWLNEIKSHSYIKIM